MSVDRINEMFAVPWKALADQAAQDANTAVNCMLSDEWHVDSGKVTYGSGGISVAFRAEMRLDAADFTSSITSPPGYVRLATDHLVVAAPLNGTWRAGIVSGFTSHFQAWVANNKLMDFHGDLTQTLEMYGIRAVADARLNTHDADRPRLLAATASLRFGVRLKGLLNYGMAPTILGVEFDPPDTYRIRVPLSVPISPPQTSLVGAPKVGFEGNLIITIAPRLEIGYDGALKITFLNVKVLGKRVKVEGSVPFKLNFDTKLPCPKFLQDLLPLPTGIPKDWGENPPAALQTAQAPPDEFDFFTPALEVEEAVLPQAADGTTDDGPGAPYHAPYGLIYEIRSFCDGSSRPQYETYHDTAIWTGHFLAAESFRYAVTQSPDVLERVKLILRGIQKLFEITEVPGLPARSGLKWSSSYRTSPDMSTLTETHGTTCHPGVLEQYYRTLINVEWWYGFGRGIYPPSRDSFIGLMMGMGYAHQLISDSAVRITIRQLVTATLTYLTKNDWNVRTKGTDYQPKQNIITTFIHQFPIELAMLRLGKTVNPQAFASQYDHYADAADFSWIPVWGGTFDPIAKYYGYNLSHGVMSMLLFLEDDPALREHYKFGFNMLRRSVRHHRNAYFNLVRIMTELPQLRAAAIQENSGFDANMTLGQETRLLLQEWLIRRHCTGGPRGLPTERPPDPGYLLALRAPDAANRAVAYTPYGSTQPSNGFVSEYALPVHKRPGGGVDFIWQRSPFSTDLYESHGETVVSAGNPELEAPGIDYLLPFWMAAYLGIVPAAN